MKRLHRRIWSFLLCCLCLCSSSRILANTTDWNVAVLDQILAGVQPGQKLVQVGDMQILVTNLTAWRNQLAGSISPDSAFASVSSAWTGGDIYYNFSNSGTNAVPPNLQQAFLDGAAEWAMFANIHFIPRTTQSNYVTVQVEAGLEGGLSAVGMVGGQQFLSISPDAWNRGTICHEIGHTLGLVHEHQRSDRDSYVTILSNNVVSNGIGNFVLLSTSFNQTAYDFLSVMHYARNYLSVSSNLNTIQPLPAYLQYLNVMGQPKAVTLSDADRAGMADVYGVGPTIGPVVTNTQDSGPGSLRAAMYYAFDHPGTQITFNISTNDPGYSNGVFTIYVTDQLPWLVNSMFIEGASQPTNSNSNTKGPLIQINGSQAPTPSTYANGLLFEGTNCVAHDLTINGFSDDGILIQGSNTTGNIVGGCYLGIDPTGSFAVPNGINPLLIQQGAWGNTIGGTTASYRNVISGSIFQGLAISGSGTTNNIVEGNYFGLNASGTESLSNTWSGVAIFGGAQNNIIGPGNVISGNGLQGVTISETSTTGNEIVGNYIGLNPAGTAAIPNHWAGVNIFSSAQSNIIGGTTAAARNVISGNDLQGVAISDTNTSANVVEGNYLGLDPTGTQAIPNADAGVEIFGGAQSNIVGGSLPGSGNVISGNNLQGVAMDEPGTSFNVVQGNVIGLNPAGTTIISNAESGIVIFNGAQSNIIGGLAPAQRNVIAGNGKQGVVISDSGTTANVVEGNFIGMNSTGSSALPNTWAGAEVTGGAQGNTIGGTIPAAANVISGNGIQGVALDGTGTAGNVVEGNFIGLDATGTFAIPNQGAGIEMFYSAQNNFVGGIGGRNYISGNNNDGVLIDNGCNSNVIQGNTIGLNIAGNGVGNTYAGVGMFQDVYFNAVGGVAPGEANLIASNEQDAVQLYYTNSLYNTVRGNSMSGNNGVGIYLYGGANGSLSAPTLNSATVTTNTTVAGSMSGLPNTTFHLDFYASTPSSFQAQGTVYIGTKDVTTSGGGSISFSAPLNAPIPIGHLVIAAATDPSGNTSPMSSAVTVAGTDSVGDGITDAWRKAHFGGTGTTTNSSSCATCDPDHDGLDNLQEYYAGTDPNNATSTLRLNEVTISSPDVLISFPSVQGITYRILYEDNLNTNGWSLLSDQILGTGGIIQLDDPGADTLPKRFFRLGVLP